MVAVRHRLLSDLDLNGEPEFARKVGKAIELRDRSADLGGEEAWVDSGRNRHGSTLIGRL